MKTYLALNNKIMKKFLVDSNIFDIKEDKNDKYDIMFCDTLKLGQNIKSDKNVYLACHYFEHLDDLSEYSNYDYFIGFGNKSLYNFLYMRHALEASTVLNGFVGTELDQEYNKDEDFIISCMEETYNNESPIYEYSQRCAKRFLKLVQPTDIKVFFNHPFPVPITNKNIWIDDVSIKMLSNSSIFFTDSVLNCRLYFNNDIIHKTILSTYRYHGIKKCLENDIIDNKSNINYLDSIEGIIKNSKLYKDIYGECSFSEFQLRMYINRFILQNDKINKKKFLVYKQNLNESFIRGLSYININNIICINEFLNNINKLQNKEKKHILINDISNEFLDILEKM